MAGEQRFDAGKTRVDDVRAKVSLMHTIVFAKKQYHFLSLLCSIRLLALRKDACRWGRRITRCRVPRRSQKN
jgi:hypothetical protein